jgi:hypothetical protein
MVAVEEMADAEEEDGQEPGFQENVYDGDERGKAAVRLEPAAIRLHVGPDGRPEPF